MGPGDGNYDGNRYHKKPILRFGDFTDRFNANRMNRSQYAPGPSKLEGPMLILAPLLFFCYLRAPIFRRLNKQCF